MKKANIVLVCIAILYVIYRCLYEYRIVALANEGDLKYKENTITYFPTPPFSIINPLKKEKLLDKIREFCQSGEFDRHYSLNNYDAKTHRDFFLYKRLVTENSLRLRAIKNDQDVLLILVTHKSDNELELVFQLDIKRDIIIGFY